MTGWKLRISWLLPVLLLAAPSVGSSAAQLDRIDLNRASEADLITLPGIGPSKAKAIVQRRKTRPYQKVQDLLKVRGIGVVLFRKVRDRVMVASRGTGRFPRNGSGGKSNKSTR